ncbi:MAG TPA: hypothetical protein VJ837_03800 [Candidatus Paceibacterota bacterium]|nr:hypothetical protein [Candidatus Paceibacterota bacterium]
MKKLVCLAAIAALATLLSAPTPLFASAMSLWNDELANNPREAWEGRVFGIPDGYLCIRDQQELAHDPTIRMEEIGQDDLGLALTGAEVVWSQEQGEWVANGSNVVCLNPQAVRNVVEALDTMLTLLRQLTDSQVPEP